MPVNVPEAGAWRDDVADLALQLLCLGEAAVPAARVDDLAVDAHLERAGCLGRHKAYRLQRVFEGLQELLCNPAAADHPLAPGAVLDLHAARVKRRRRPSGAGRGHLGSKAKRSRRQQREEQAG